MPNPDPREVEDRPLAGVHDETVYHVLNDVRGQSWFHAYPVFTHDHHR